MSFGKRVRAIILDNVDVAAFFAPEVAYADARRYLPDLLRKRLNPEAAVPAAMAVLDTLESVVRPVPVRAYASLRAVALARIERRDPDDWPILATALLLECPVWTEDQDFFGTGVPTWTTDRVELYLGHQQ